MFTHLKVKKLLSAYLDGETSLKDKALIDSHIRECEHCQKHLAELKKLSVSLKAWPEENLSPDLAQKIEKTFSKYKATEGFKMRTQAHYFQVATQLSLTIIILFGAVLSTQVYLKRGIQGRFKTAADNIGDKFSPGNANFTSTTRLKYSADDSGEQFSPMYNDQLALNTKAREEPGKPVDQDGSISYKDVSSTEAKFLYGSPNEQIAQNGQYYLGGPAIHGAAGTNLFSEGMVSAGSTQNLLGAPTKEVRLGAYSGSFSREDRFYSEKEAPYYYEIPPTPGSESYRGVHENGFKGVRWDPLSTFSIDVDTASYANIRRFLNQNQMPPKDAVRIEEMINYFEYDYPQPQGDERFSLTTEVANCPWNSSHNLVLIGLQAKKLHTENLPPSNLVFLIDASGSMADHNKLPWIKAAFRPLVAQLRPQDKVAIVAYQTKAWVVLNPTSGSNKGMILNAIDRLYANGSTAGEAGLRLAYNVATNSFAQAGNNRIILVTDGDFNTGPSSDWSIGRLIEEKRKTGIFLSVLGFGTGNLKDSKLELMADKGNGNYSYIDNLEEAEKVFVGQFASTLYTIAKDAKIQIEFNPATVKSYRLIGYENRLLKKEDFNNDKKDAGEIGVGHSVTALYEIVPNDAGGRVSNVDPLIYEKGYGQRYEGGVTNVDPLTYQENRVTNNREVYYNSETPVYRERFISPGGDLMTVKLRYKRPNEESSRLITARITSNDIHPYALTGNLKFASAVAEFGLLLHKSPNKANATYEQVIRLAQDSLGFDPHGNRAEFINLVRTAQRLDQNTPIYYRHLE